MSGKRERRRCRHRRIWREAGEKGGEEERHEIDERWIIERERNRSKNIHGNRCECSRGRLKSQSNALEPQSHDPTSKATVIKVWCLHNVLLLANYLEFKSTLTGLMTLANRTTATRGECTTNLRCVRDTRYVHPSRSGGGRFWNVEGGPAKLAFTKDVQSRYEILRRAK